MLKPFSLEEAFVLHSRPYKETSLIVELFTRNYGRVSVVAKGAKRPKSKISVIKTPFSLFLVSCSGKGDLKNLTNSEIKRYLQNGDLEIIQLPFGENNSKKSVSDNPKDRKKSVYSIDAMLERKIEIVEIMEL